jgi:hypothetical protein
VACTAPDQALVENSQTNRDRLPLRSGDPPIVADESLDERDLSQGMRSG